MAFDSARGICSDFFAQSQSSIEAPRLRRRVLSGFASLLSLRVCASPPFRPLVHAEIKGIITANPAAG
jgi:hypothetical protein